MEVVRLRTVIRFDYNIVNAEVMSYSRNIDQTQHLSIMEITLAKFAIQVLAKITTRVSK